MKKVTVVGVGVSVDTLTLEAINVIKDAEVLMGAPRILELVKELCKDTPKMIYPHYLPKDMLDIIEADKATRFVVLVSGDTGFYSAATGIADMLTAYDVQFIAGISTVNIFFAKLKLPWQNSKFISVHGRGANIIDTVRRNRLTFCLTGNNINKIGLDLKKSGLEHIKIYIGEDLGMPQERVCEMLVSDLIKEKFSSLTVLLFLNEKFDERIAFGLSDSKFFRLEGIPMTKMEIRAILMSKLQISPYDICWDIGAGTGSVTVEMALSSYCGHVYSVERRKDAIPLIEKNCKEFHIGNVTPICKEAAKAIKLLPAPDVVFIGGSGGELLKVISTALDKNKKARIIITAVTLETVTSAISILEDAGLDTEIIQISAARGKKVSTLHMMEGQNPVTIICAGGKL